jgi:hypothetical protein
MKTLIVYYSLTENNEKLARMIGNELKCEILKIEEFKKRTWLTIFLDIIFNRLPSVKTAPYSLANYSHIIFIAPIWAAKIASPLRTFIRNEKLNVTSYSFITLCGGAKGQLEKIMVQLTGMLGKAPYAVAELSIQDVVPKGKNPGNYRVSDRDLQVYKQKIDDFLHKERMPLARGWGVESEYGD